jgi:hypothetical protein
MDHEGKRIFKQLVPRDIQTVGTILEKSGMRLSRTAAPKDHSMVTFNAIVDFLYKT